MKPKFSGRSASSVSSSGQGSASSSGQSSSNSSSSGGLKDGGPDCHPLMVCGLGDLPGKPCACDKSLCLDGMCKTDADAAATQGLFCHQGFWTAIPASLDCCPFQGTTCGNQVCVFGGVLGPNSTVTQLSSTCKPYSCAQGKPLDCNCFGGNDPCGLLQLGGSCKADPAKNDIFCIP